MHKPKFSRRTDKYIPRHVPVAKEGEALTTSAMIASLDAEGRAAVAAPFGHALNDLVTQGHDIVEIYRYAYFRQSKPRSVLSNGYG
jgi:transketolase